MFVASQIWSGHGGVLRKLGISTVSSFVISTDMTHSENSTSSSLTSDLQFGHFDLELL